MDSDRFDTLARTLSTTGTHRGPLRLLAAVPVAGGLLALGDPEALAGKNGKDGKHGRTARTAPASIRAPWSAATRVRTA